MGDKREKSDHAHMTRVRRPIRK